MSSYVEENIKNAKQGLNLHTPLNRMFETTWSKGSHCWKTKLSRVEMNQVMEFLSKYYEISASSQTCVVHGDFHYDNMLWDEEDMVETLQNNPRKPDFQKGYSRFFDRE
ncbi:phosphotransferase [Paenibacillus sp. ISL-20]|uniref:phosphotransferase n=1 Tax=Paenibacillus sp. ISL-20 TaxID=2819163 RepID=UPI001BE85FE9|nr:phosphotransferase [Paenibacillus sp. ISL-20]MBT2763465.1 phosphotransferase [Paenibacillus sp. ISL-20]